MENIEKLKIETENNIKKNRNFEYKLSKKLDHVETYYEKYIENSINPHSVKPVFVNNKQVKLNTAPIHNYNTLLAMAFTKAEKQYSILKNNISDNIKEQLKSGKQVVSDDEISNDNNEATGKFILSPLECLVMSSHLLQGKNSSLLKSIKKAEQQQLNDFVSIFEIIDKVLTELRNYHSHILHEPGPLKFENLYGNEIPHNKLDSEKWLKAKNWFINKFEEVKLHLGTSLNKTILDYENKIKGKNKEENNDTIKKNLFDSRKVFSTINNYKFENGGFITNEAKLFIACMFLRKSDAEYFIKKWTGLKKPEGVWRTTQTFFTYYSISDKKTLFAQSTSLLKFRKIIGILSTMPMFNKDCFEPFNKYIADKNTWYSKKAAEEDNILKKKKVSSYCLPIRKNFKPVIWYLDYLNGKGYLNDFLIACYKTPAERKIYLDKSNITNIASLKLKMKVAKNEEKIELTKTYNELKRNFVFKEPKNISDNYCIKNGSAIFQYNLTAEIKIQISVSTDFLMKWVFVDLVLNKDMKKSDNTSIIAGQIKNKIKAQYYALKNNKFQNRPDLTIPPCLSTVAENPKLIYTIEKAKKFISTKLADLFRFKDINSAQKCPWKFGAKRKIDIILEYVHLSYKIKTFDTNKTVDDQRHDALSDVEYLDAFEFIRFYGKSYNTLEFNQFFYKQKFNYFQSIHGRLSQTKRLEDLFNVIINDFISLYEILFINEHYKVNLEKFISIFNPNRPSKISEISKHANMFASNQILESDMINIRELADNSEDLKNWIQKINDPNRKKIDKKENATDFSLMRHFLQNRNIIDTNTDFFMKIIMEEARKSNVYLKLNENGHISGNTTLFNTLMKNKTDELMLFEIAKDLWFKTYGTPLDEPTIPIIERGKECFDNYPYKDKFYFYKLFTNELILKIFNKNGDKNDFFEIKIKPKKYDDEFQFYETDEIYNYIKEYKPFKAKDSYYHFEDLNKNMKDVLAKYLDDVFLLFSVEKKVVQDNYSFLANKLEDQYNNGTWSGFQLIFGNAEKQADASENLLAKLIYNQINPKEIAFTLKQFIMYRNNILHRQFQKDKQSYSKIKLSLLYYCKQNGLI